MSAVLWDYSTESLVNLGVEVADGFFHPISCWLECPVNLLIVSERVIGENGWLGFAWPFFYLTGSGSLFVLVVVVSWGSIHWLRDEFCPVLLLLIVRVILVFEEWVPYLWLFHNQLFPLQILLFLDLKAPLQALYPLSLSLLLPFLQLLSPHLLLFQLQSSFFPC